METLRLALLGGGAAAAATTLGTLPVLFARTLPARVQDACLGFGAGVMLAASAFSLVLPALEAFRPDLVMVSAGFDAHRSDPLASLNFEAEDFAWATTELVRAAGRLCGGRLVSALEGGYDLAALRECTAAHLAALLDG